MKRTKLGRRVGIPHSFLLFGVLLRVPFQKKISLIKTVEDFQSKEARASSLRSTGRAAQRSSRPELLLCTRRACRRKETIAISTFIPLVKRSAWVFSFISPSFSSEVKRTGWNT